MGYKINLAVSDKEDMICDTTIVLSLFELVSLTRLSLETSVEDEYMAWTMDYLEEGGIVFAKLLSPIGKEGVRQLCIEQNLLARKHQSNKYFLDHRGVENMMSVLDLDKVPEMLKEIGAKFDVKVAVLLDSSAPKSNLFYFLKNVLHLESVQLEIFFDDEDKAITWLKAD